MKKDTKIVSKSTGFTVIESNKTKQIEKIKQSIRVLEVDCCNAELYFSAVLVRVVEESLTLDQTKSN